MAYNYHNYGMSRAAYRRYGKDYYDTKLMFHEIGVLFWLLFMCIKIVVYVVFAPIVLIVWLCGVLQENNAAKLHEEAEKKMLEYDMAAKEDFSKLTGELLRECLDNGYKIQSPITLNGDVRFNFYQSIENVGVGISDNAITATKICLLLSL